MARDRTGSSLNPYMEDTLFVGARIPDTIRRMVKQVSKLDKASFRKILQGIHRLVSMLQTQHEPKGVSDSIITPTVLVSVLEGEAVDVGILEKLQLQSLPEEVLTTVYSGLHSLLVAALRLPPTSLKIDKFKSDLVELGIPAELIPDLASVVFGERRPSIDSSALEGRNRLPRLDGFRWRVDVAISTSVLNRVLEPTVLMEMKLSNGKIHNFEVPVSKFHELRYNTAYMLKEMEDVEKKSILKIQD